MPTICYAVTDLIFATKIRTTAQAVGTVSLPVRTCSELLAASKDAEIAIIDLHLDNESPIEMIRATRRLPSPPKIVAFLSHVHTELAQAAKEAGADLVLPRSKFTQRLPQILSGNLESTL